ncbi:hypothetical protein GOV14_03790 [Candidatus Pacearchaeota archaeon]|nr:hypothetical protein [Candidatus Pacearchaeota archaeon]
MINLKEANIVTDEVRILESLVRAAILNPAEGVRSKAIKMINTFYNGNIKKGFMGDNQLFLKYQTAGKEPRYIYVCEMPRTYRDKPSNPHNFIT